MDSLSKRIREDVVVGHFRGIRLSNVREISDNLFVNDVLLFGMIERSVWNAFHGLFSRFCAAIGMMENSKKLCIYFEDEGDKLVSEQVKETTAVFKFPCVPLGAGFKYFGFNLKPNNYSSDPGGYWWPPAYSTWGPTIVSFIFSVSAQLTIFSTFSGRELLEPF